MADKLKIKQLKKISRQRRIRAKISGDAQKPRLSVFRSLKHISAQLIDDQAGKTIVVAGDLEVKSKKGAKIDKAKEVGMLIAKKALDKKVSQAVFDRSGSKYHGRIKAVADGAREGGLKF
jgi:large subunit ribosomal protein L18